MSPPIALQDPIFTRWLVVIFAVLGVAGLVLAALEFGFGRQVGGVWSTYRSWVAIVLLGFVVIFAGRIPTTGGIALLAVFGFREFARACGILSDRWLTGAVWFGILLMAGASVVSDRLFTQLPLVCVAVILMLPIVRNRTRGELYRLALAILGFVSIGWMFEHLALLTRLPNAYGYLIFVIFATQVCDVAGYIFGKLFGRHQLRSEISPRKTWEGALGALALAMLLPWLLRFSLPAFGVPELIAAGLIVGIGAQLGDLSMSLIKRELGTKDMGASIPGHGGILDRIDSLIWVAPMFMQLASHAQPLR